VIGGFGETRRRVDLRLGAAGSGIGRRARGRGDLRFLPLVLHFQRPDFGSGDPVELAPEPFHHVGDDFGSSLSVANEVLPSARFRPSSGVLGLARRLVTIPDGDRGTNRSRRGGDCLPRGM